MVRASHGGPRERIKNKSRVHFRDFDHFQRFLFAYSSDISGSRASHPRFNRFRHQLHRFGVPNCKKNDSLRFKMYYMMFKELEVIAIQRADGIEMDYH